MSRRKLHTRALGLIAWLFAASACAAEEAVGNPYGLTALWAQGDWVAKGTLLILVLMSIGSWYVIFTKLAEQSRVMKFAQAAQAAQASFWQAASVREGADGLDTDSPFRFIAEKGLEGASKHDGLLGQARIDKVAGPVGESLIMTAIGLAMAVPAVLGYNWLVRRNKVAMEEVQAFGSDLHALLLGSAPK